MLDPTQHLALETLQLNKQAFIFCPSRASAEKTAEEIAKLTSFQHPELEQKILHAVSTPTKQCRRLSHCVRKGIAFHHAGLVAAQRELIETEFRNGTLRIICATPTLAMGLSLPAFRVIIKSLKRYSEQWGMDWIPVLEYLQMAGRAGRPEFEKFGEAIAMANSEAEKEEIHARYICGEPEEIYSKLAAEPVLRTYLLSLISTSIIHDQPSMNEFFRQTFWAHQYGDLEKLQILLVRMFSLLEQWEFVKSSSGEQGDFVAASSVAASSVGKAAAFRATLIGQRVSELYLDPLTARHLLDGLRNAAEMTMTPFSLLQLICCTLEMRPLLRLRKKDEELVQEELTKHYGQLLMNEPSPFDPDYDDFINSVKTALFLEDWISEKDEDFLMEKYDIRPGEIRAKLEIADWLLYALEELSTLLHYREALREIRKVRLRVQDGVKEELLPLLKLKGIGRVRGRKLYSNSIRDLGDVKKAGLATLSQILGKAIAEDVQKQVGEEVEAVPEGKRKGQVSVTKF